VNPCHPSPCGINANCRVAGNSAVCECIREYTGDAYGQGCRPECTVNSDCPKDKSCINNKCVNPCHSNICGYRAECHSINHNPVCACPTDLVGDPFVECKTPIRDVVDPCNPSPCGPNGRCRQVNGAATCDYPECILNSDCPFNKACFNQKCQNPCTDSCGVNAVCNVINHQAVCMCPQGYIGSPYVRCSEPAREPAYKPECTSDYECSQDKSCINQQCVNPCTVRSNVCAQNAECHVQAHRAICSCHVGYTGNPQYSCHESKYFYGKHQILIRESI
jgi:hypothetical protein